jgi:hypothetical protein
MTARSPAFEASTVHRKTAAGRAELASRSADLSPRQRQLLVLVDGRRSDGELAALIGREALAELLAALRALGLVVSADQASGARTEPVLNASAMAEPAPVALPGERLEAIRALMKDSARRHLGLLAQEVHLVIEQASCAHTLRAAIARWHLALRDSRNGHAEADALLGSVRALLEGG